MARPLVRQRSHSPGRLRLDVAPMVSNPAMAAAVQEAASRIPGVTQAKASPISGSLLVTYNPAAGPADLPAIIRTRVEASLTQVGGRVAGVIRMQGTPLSRVLSESGDWPREALGPAVASASSYALTALQGLGITSIVNVATGGSSRALLRLGVAGTRSQLAVLGGGAMVLTVGGLWVSSWRRRAWRRLFQLTEHRLRTATFRHIQEQDLSFFDAHATGQLMALLTSDVTSIGAFVEGADALIESALTIATAGVGLLRTSPRIALVAGASVPLMLLPQRLLQQGSRQSFSTRADANVALSQALENVLGGILEVKSFTAEQLEASRIAELSRDLAKESVRAASLAILQNTLAGNVYYAGYTQALAYVARRVATGDLPQDQLISTNFWYPQFVQALERIQGSRETFYGARSAAERICAVLDTAPRIRDGAIRLDAKDIRGDVVLDDISFGYRPASPVLRNVSLAVPGGSTLGIVGPTGSGKSTLLRLLLRFYDPDAGRILLDGHDLRDLVIADLRAAIALVSQDVYLFNGTVRHNLLYGRPGATEEAIVAALEQAGGRDLLDSLPNGLSTEVGERGNHLSGGQRQRVAIARALLKDAPVLALDEATSHLDYATEAVVKSSLRQASRGRTLILIAHRLSTIRDADQIVVLDHGTIREQGTHDALLGLGGMYADLWRLQSGETDA